MMEDIEDEMMEDEQYDEEGDFQENSYLSEDDKSLRKNLKQESDASSV